MKKFILLTLMCFMACGLTYANVRIDAQLAPTSINKMGHEAESIRRDTPDAPKELGDRKSSHKIFHRVKRRPAKKIFAAQKKAAMLIAIGSAALVVGIGVILVGVYLWPLALLNIFAYFLIGVSIITIIAGIVSLTKRRYG